MLKLKITLYLLCSSFFIITKAQQTSGKNFFYNAIKGNSIIVLPKVITHIAPSVGAAIDDSLDFGTPIKVLMLVPYSESINGIEVPWAKCIYKKGEFNKVTFILSNQLALSTANINNTLVCVSFKTATKDSIFFETNIINNAKTIKLLQTFGFEKQSSTDSFKIELINTHGLKKVSNIFGVHIFNTNLKHSYHYIECENSNQLTTLEKVEVTLNTSPFSGKIWEFPSSKKVKKNRLLLQDFSTNESKNTPVSKVFHFKNCSLKQ
jgi:hypothetical protein